MATLLIFNFFSSLSYNPTVWNITRGDEGMTTYGEEQEKKGMGGGREGQDRLQHPQHLIGGHEMTSTDTEVDSSARAGRRCCIYTCQQPDCTAETATNQE